ncbi:PstS family phosphate ABC transporter substrate-binding protein [Alteromonas ponticola]|uniref:PstS family phosphate ABC transporter substrate-binding protein n=1 Tax=Alteromonas ponticola TaxID=2720613 RepID=A0ABX1R4G4_9ALTE|nr:PstS family phosphate ABC transporter substrate-binding protein [Alteromonas ponticola]NMH60541.1 PstS family phosphate ABC transporter substrate-binding protein [Alteromonas ponticola]
MKKLITTVAMVAATSAISMQAQAQSRDYINIVGSSTVYPFSTVVAERFGKSTQFKTPKVESTGSGGGIKLFCQGVGVQFPDITNASRAIKSSEVEMCKENGVKGIVEVLIGFDGIVIGNSADAKQLDLSRKDLFLALAKQVPDPKGGETLVANPYKMWSDVNPALPKTKIEVLGPPPTSGTRDAFVELVMEEGCKEIDWIAHIEEQSKAESDAAKSKQLKNKFKGICHTVREDGAFVEAGENDNLIVQKLNANPNALGIFGFSFLDQNIDQIQGSAIDGQDPTFESIADGAYPVSRPLYFYVKKAHVDMIPGIREYLAEFTSKKAAGEEGYLTEKGMIPLNSDRLDDVRQKVESLTTL